MKMIEKYRGKKVLVLGLGKSGVNAAKLLKKLGAEVTVNDKNTPSDLTQVNELKNEGIEVITGSHPLELLENIDLMVKNPGIPYTNVLVNGKPTTTTMISLMLNQGQTEGKAYVAGNIGVPASQVAQEATNKDTIVTELSSFQLLGITEYHPKVAVLTNIYEAHIDYHGTRENYVNAKMRIVMNQTEDDYFVVNWDNEEWQELSQRSKAKIVPFSRLGKSKKGAYVADGYLFYKEDKIMPVADIKVPGTHNVENALAAIAVAKIFGKSNEDIKEILTTFSGVRHRTQYVTTLNGRKFYNDSKATNMEATEKALAGFNNPVVLLAGGLDRGFTFEKLEPSLKNKVHAMIVFGETADLMAKAGKEAGVEKIIKTKDAVSAVPEAYKVSNEGDVILLSPACASWDQWPTFEVRGDKFIEAVEKLTKELEEK